MSEYADIEEVRQFCDERARHGREGAVRDPNDTLGFKNLFIETILQQAVASATNLDQSDCVLDLGCGSGLLAEKLASRVGKVYGIDISYPMLKLALQVEIPRSLFSQFDGMALPYADGAFTSVIPRDLVHLLTDEVLARLFTEVRRVLHPEGRYVCVEFVSFNPQRQRRVKERMERSPSALIEAMEACGFACGDHYPVRRGRSLLQYLIRYGAFSRRRVVQLADRELRRMKRRQDFTTNYNAEWLFAFRPKP